MSVSAFFRWDFGWEAALVLTGNADEWRPLTEVIHRECGPPGALHGLLLLRHKDTTTFTTSAISKDIRLVIEALTRQTLATVR